MQLPTYWQLLYKGHKMNHISFKIFGKWTILVGLNAILSIMLALDILISTHQIMGVIMGIFTFIIIYSAIDLTLYKRQLEEWRRSLIIGVILKALLQFVFVVELIAGILATGAVQAIYPYAVSLSYIDEFFRTYLTVMIDGILLSFVAGLITVIVKYIRKRFRKRSQERMA